ncbi:hypothetical protein ATE47_12360 [Chryseobacterium sp. IHB B 17019]|uniref:hypothetical protein n=1 Tax=Chryseobacterium sp. IHB B 17019 TaxID=1721091 RepID=UPI00071F6A5F|nr:hypothetical protein [Chryseobacterium sp. IHB B 17019]ALR31265.1 hypothetical protein ATE47_12360 [Chryseobacterium sp. IHB B 17019]
MEKLEIIKKISSELNLQYETQDWGIINADPNRVREFISYYNKSDCPNIIKYELFELIIASFNELILEGKNEKLINDFFTDFINNNLTLPFTDILDYWNNIYNKEEFPVAKYFPKY